MVACANADVSFQAWSLRTEAQCPSYHGWLSGSYCIRTWLIQSKAWNERGKSVDGRYGINMVAGVWVLTLFVVPRILERTSVCFLFMYIYNQAQSPLNNKQCSHSDTYSWPCRLTTMISTVLLKSVTNLYIVQYTDFVNVSIVTIK